jgi:hypothetical protein
MNKIMSFNQAIFFFGEISILKKISDDEPHHPWPHMLSYKKGDDTTNNTKKYSF